MSKEIILVLREMTILHTRPPAYVKFAIEINSFEQKQIPYVLNFGQEQPYKYQTFTDKIISKKYFTLTHKPIKMNEIFVFGGLRSANEMENKVNINCDMLLQHKNQQLIGNRWVGRCVKTVGKSSFQIFIYHKNCSISIAAQLYSVVVKEKIQKIYISIEEHYAKTFYFLHPSIKMLKQLIKKMLQNHQSLNTQQKYTKSLQYYDKRIQETTIAIQAKNKEQYLQYLQNELSVYNQIIAFLWNEFKRLICVFYNEDYFQNNLQNWRTELKEYNKRIHYQLTQDCNEEISPPLIIPFEQNLIKMKIYAQEYRKLTQNRNKKMQANQQMEMIIEGSEKINLSQGWSMKKDKQNKAQLIVLVHGYQASGFDMQCIASVIQTRCPTTYILISTTNEGRTENKIQDSAHRLALQIKNFINVREMHDLTISFVCHSMGGLIARASLIYLQSHRQHFDKFITLCTPHLGYLAPSSNLVSVSLWVMKQLSDQPCLSEMTFVDSPVLTNTFLYKLAMRKELKWFKQVVTIGSREDQFVPFQSATFQTKDFFFNTTAAEAYKTLHQTMIETLADRLIRIEIFYNDKIMDLSTLIGRTAHVKILFYTPLISLLVDVIF